MFRSWIAEVPDPSNSLRKYIIRKLKKLPGLQLKQELANLRGITLHEKIIFPLHDRVHVCSTRCGTAIQCEALKEGHESSECLHLRLFNNQNTMKPSLHPGEHWLHDRSVGTLTTQWKAWSRTPMRNPMGTQWGPNGNPPEANGNTTHKNSSEPNGS